MEIHSYENLFFLFPHEDFHANQTHFCTKTRLETEANDNSEMVDRALPLARGFGADQKDCYLWKWVHVGIEIADEATALAFSDYHIIVPICLLVG